MSHFLSIALLLVSATTQLGAQTVLIDFDDGIAGNGAHDSSIRSGTFTDQAYFDNAITSKMSLFNLVDSPQ